jgi:EAL domain-containing protein (putative c-di-GMP-specific phosphodiesterase class I)/PleD family two-component response regulator
MNNDIWAATAPATISGRPADTQRSPLLEAKVMMVDDEPLMTDLIQAYLEDEGYGNFVVTNDPREALELLRREEPGVLLLDLMMPQMSGFDLLEAIRADRELRYTPVIVLTASTGAESKLRALKLGATDFLSKPVDASELVLRVRNTLAFRQYHNRMINFDATTGLPNQRLFDRGIDEMVARRDLVGGLVALFSIAVPECRQIQESMGQATADNLTKVLARRLDRFANAANHASAISTSAERAPRVARLGGDHFGVVLEGLANAEEVEMAARRMVAVLSEPVVLGFHEVGPTPWIGISLAPADGHIASVLRQGADLAASSARQLGGTNFMFVSPDLNERSLHKMTLGSQLRGAVQRRELRLHYQPKVDVTTNRIIGAESLVRWLHPEHGLLPPGRFISLAEDLGLIGQIGQWVIEQACLDAANWVRAGLGNLKVAVNVAKPQFVSGDLCSTVRYNVAKSGLPARLLVMELTESMLMDDVDAAQKLMADLKSLGVTLSIDDFGTGFSSLSYLKSFPLDELKIDRSFIADLPGVKSDVAIVRTIIDLGHRLGMSVIAEGIESADQLACIRQLGCDNYQGFLFSKPLTSQAFAELVAQENARLSSVG